MVCRSKITLCFALIFSFALLMATAVSAADTGWLSPTANVQNGNNDDWTNPSNAYTNGGGAATESGSDQHRFYNYGFVIPPGATITGIETKIDSWSSDSTGCQIGVDLSWNSGSSWSSEKTQSLTGSETTYTLGSSSDDWGSHTWTSSEFSDTAFRTRVNDIDPGNQCTNDATTSLDWIQVKVHYTPDACGSGIITGNEICDDGNTANGDGCSSTCTVEDNFSCTGQPSVCAYENPQIPNSCGIDIALIIDSSGSIDSTELGQMKTAFKGFVDAFLPNTPSQFAVVEFDDTAALTQDYTNDITSIKGAIDGASSGGSTNWEDALEEAHAQFDNRANKPDIFIFASDGNPNRYGDSSTLATEATAVAQAVTDADAIKADGIRIITVGIGDNLDANNLIAISSADAYYDADFATLAADLAQLADDLCGGTVTVRKYVDGQPAQGWEFSAQASNGALAESTGTTDIDGFATFNVENITGTASVDLAETLQGGYAFVNASCVADNQATGTIALNGVDDIAVGANDAVFCVVNNHLITFCGDSVTQNPNDAQVAEQCDVGASNGIACTPGYGSSCTYCDSSCGNVTLTGPYCGNGIIDGSETCDGTNGTSEHYTCSQACQLEYVPYCGDGNVDQGEFCDDSNNQNGDGCTNTCVIEICGDGIDNNGNNEACDDGNLISGDGCTSACVLEFCGDYTVNNNGTESCDNGAVNGIACVPEYGSSCAYCGNACQPVNLTGEHCGDNVVNGAEACEAGDQIADPEHYTCNAQTCTLDYVPYCGDNNVDQGEQCDAGNQTGNYCTPGYGESCTFCGINCINETIVGEYCGDGIMNGAEECDGQDGVGAHESCGETCLIVPLPYCGDLVKNGQEQCDGTDGVGEHQECNTDCNLVNLPYCGDDILNGDEQCDDGNNVDNDGCSATCTLEQLQSCEEQGGVQTCIGESNSCDTYADSQSCTFAGCDWSASQGQNDVTQWSESFASPASDWSPYASIGNGISHITNDHLNCINDANDDCIKFNGDGTPAASNISKQSNVDLSACSDGSATISIGKIKEYGTLESDDCAYFWFSADGGATWGSKTTIFCDDNPASTFSASIPDVYLTNQMRIRMERRNFGGEDERAYFDGLSVTCDIAGESVCQGSPDACSAYNDNEQACLSAGCDTTCEIPQVFCGDGIVNQQNETCDAGVNNGVTCEPAYGNSCSYCDNACQPVNLTGGYCGDLITNGDEECDGSAPDGFVCTENCALDELTCEDLAITIVSDTQTLLADGNSSVAAWVHPGWTASVNGATWVWESEFIADPSVETRANFTRTFILPGSVDGATLRVAADNGYTVWLNGVQVGADPEEFNYLAGHEDTYDVASEIVVGVNTLVFEVVNHPYSTQDPQVNPAALLYRLETSSDLCAYCGDGIVNQESEQCDGSDGVGAHQECNSDCNLVNLPYCGDGVVNQESEECDLQAGVPEGYTCFQDCSLHLTCEEAKSQGLLYGEIDSEGHAVVTNDADEDFLVTLASYEMYAPLIEDQELYSSDSQIVEGDSSAEFSVTVPACAYQIDLICGEPLPNNPAYSEEEKLDFAFSEGLEYCVPGQDEGADLVVLKGFPQCGNYVFSCSSYGFEATNYYWYFGDGQIQPNSTNSDVYHTYEDDGTYTVTCTATNGEQSASASIEIEAVTCPTCEEAIAMGLLTGEIDSEGHAIVHNDANINYTVSLASYEMYALLIEDQVLFDSDSADVAAFGGETELSVEVPACTYQIDLVCGSPLPFAPLYGDRVIDFDFANQEAAFCVPTGHEDEVTVDLSIGDGFPQGADYVFACDAQGFVPTGYYWYFGDGQIQPNSPNDNVWHTYTANGDYIVACTATNGTTWQTDTLLVSVEGIVDPSVTVSVDPEYPQGPAYVFLCEADGFTPLGYDWDFGDGEYLYDQLTADVYHEFSANGEYTVTCTASDGETTESGNVQAVVETCGEYELLITQVDPNPAAPEAPFTVSGTLTVGGLPVETETVAISFDEASQDASVFMGAWLGGFNAPTTPGEYLVSASFNGTCGEPVTASTTLFVEVPQQEGGDGEDELFQTESVEQPLAGSPESNSHGGCAWGYHESDGMCVKDAPAVNTLAFDGGDVAGGNGDGELLPEESLTEDGLSTEGDDASGDLLTGAVIGGGLLSWSWLLVLIAIVAVLGGAYWWQQQ